MNNLNSLIIEGNIVKPGNFVEPSEGFKVYTFCVAVNRWYKNKNGDGNTEVSYFDVETYGKMAEVCQKQVEKGRGVRVVGRLKQDRWNDSDGKQHQKCFIVAEHIEYKPKYNGDTTDMNADTEVESNEKVRARTNAKVEETVF